MPVRITWSDNEIALLVEMTINTINNPQSYKNNVESLSATLRKMAINKGIEIDEKYRNCNGIILQMTKMRYLLTNGREGLPGASNDFKKIADLYINNRAAFVSLCEESKKMIDSDKSFSTEKIFPSEFTQTGFYKWMIANGKSEYMAKNYASVINSCEAFACKSGYPDNKIYENADAAKIISELLDDIQFEIFSLRKQRKPKYALLLYLDYISDKPIENNEKQSIPYENNEFFGWLLNHKGFNEKRANEYVNALIEAETMARRNKFTSKKLISSDDIAEVIRTKRKLELFDEYIRKNEESEFVFSYAINEYISFLKYSESEIAEEHDVEPVSEEQQNCGDNPSHDALCVLDMKNSIINEEPEQIEIVIETPTESYDETIIDNCNRILEENFEDGYILGNYMHQMRFISYYEDTFGSSVGKEADELDRMLKSIGNVIEDRVFAAKNGEEAMLLDDISLEINNLLDEGASCVYMECVYEKYASRLNTELSIYNSDTLTNVLRNRNKINAKYRFKSDRIANTTDDCQLDVKKILQNSHVSISYDEIKEILWYIPIDNIKLALIHIDGAVWAGPELYFYAPNFNISSEELSRLTAAMHSEIAAKGYLVTKDVVRLFMEKCPSSAMDYYGFKDYLIRNILKWKLSDQFSGSSAILCEKGVAMDYDEIFRSFAANHSRLTLSEITEFQREIDMTRIYWNSIMKEMIRISPEELVNKDNVHFDIEAVDSVLDTMCPGEYEALKNIDIFISFPACGYKWNGYVLESYLRDYSKLFRLEQMSISSDEFNGVMVRRTSLLKEYNDVAADMLAHNDSWNDEKTALRCLVNEGFQQRAANKKIGEIIKKAKHIRENNL